MTDLVNALRANGTYSIDEEWTLRRDAADEIERLRALVEDGNRFLVRAFAEQQRMQEMVYSIYNLIRKDTVEEEADPIVTGVHFHGDYRDQ